MENDLETLKYNARLAAQFVCAALRAGCSPKAVEPLQRALCLLPDCDDEEQRTAQAAIAQKYGFRG